MLCFILYLRAISKYKKPPPGGTYIWRGNLTEGFLRYEFRGLIFGGAYFRNFTVFVNSVIFNHGIGVDVLKENFQNTACLLVDQS